MLSEQALRRWITQVRQGRRTTEALVEALLRLPFENLGFARLDSHRTLRRGLPEIIFASGKTPQQLIAIVRRLARHRDPVILTRLDPSIYDAVRRALPALHYEPVARIAYHHRLVATRPRGLVTVVTGGTSDVPVAEEALVALRLFGSRSARLYDVGVAGLHRLLSSWSLLQRARVIIVMAGMEGALPSVVAGLVRCPVIAVPTSVGYGASFQGIAPLLTMMNSCVPGIGVVNIDNGFGAAYLAHLINASSSRRS